MAFELLVVSFLGFYSISGLTVDAHVFRTGLCPNLDVVDNFNYDKFQGKWYAIEKSQTTSSCLKYIFTQNNGSKQVQEKYRPFGIKIFDWNDLSQIGPLTVPDSQVPAKMTVQFPFSMNPFTANTFWVVATDYETYASVWSCRPFIFGHFQSAMILSRNRTLDRNIINKLRAKFDYYGVDKNDFSAIAQQDCYEVDFNPQISEENIKNLFMGIGVKINNTAKANATVKPEIPRTEPELTTSNPELTTIIPELLRANAELSTSKPELSTSPTTNPEVSTVKLDSSSQSLPDTTLATENSENDLLP